MSQKSLGDKFFDFLHYFIQDYQLFFFQLIDKYTEFLFIGTNFKNIVQRYHSYFKYKNLTPFDIYIGRLICRTSILQLKCNPKIWNFYYKLFSSSSLYLESFRWKFEFWFFDYRRLPWSPSGITKKSKFEFWLETLQISRAWWE